MRLFIFSWIGRSSVTNWPGSKSKDFCAGISIQNLLVCDASCSMRMIFPVCQGWGLVLDDYPCVIGVRSVNDLQCIDPCCRRHAERLVEYPGEGAVLLQEHLLA